MHTCDCNLFQFCFKTEYRLPESSPGLLRGQFFKLFSQLLSEKGDVIVVIAMRLLPKAVFRMRQRTADQRSENNEQRKKTTRLHVGTTLNFHALESLFVEEFGFNYLSCYLRGHVQPAVMRGWTTGATRCQSKATCPLWTGSRSFTNSGAQSSDQTDLSASSLAGVKFPRSVHEFS